MAQSGTWFKKNYKVTPPTSFSVSKDIAGSDLKTAWYDSRFYRINLLWEHDNLRIRDIHLFDEQFPSVYETEPVTSNECTFFPLPVVDGYIWSKRNNLAGLRFKAKTDTGEVLLAGGDPKFSKPAKGILHISWPLTTVKGSLEIDLSEGQVKINLVSKTKLDWYLELNTPPTDKLPFEKIDSKELDCKFENTAYKLKAVKGSFSKPGTSAIFRLQPDGNSIVLNMADIK
jgi:hypothetical protein